MMETGRREEAVRQALDALTASLDDFAAAYAAWAADPDAPDAAARLEKAQAQVDRARDALARLEEAMDEHR